MFFLEPILFGLIGSKAESQDKMSRGALWTLGLCALSIPPWLSDSPVAFLCAQVIQATVEKHKQKSETFRAFGGACSQDEEPSLSPDQPVSQQLGTGGSGRQLLAKERGLGV